jgi:response regulator RpfG family c-di-GMP phosphodiesterase
MFRSRVGGRQGPAAPGAQRQQELLRTAPHPPPAMTGAGPPRYDLSRLAILVVDDSIYMTHLLRAVMRALNVGRIHVANNTADAWTAFVRQQPDLIVSDWKMQPLSGVEFLNKVRTAVESPNRFVPFVFLTGYSEEQKITAARDAGANDFLVKPVTAKLIYERIVGVVEEPRPFIESKHYFGPDRRRRRSPRAAGEAERRAAREA